MNKNIKDRWVEALRSGNYKQGTAALRYVNPETGAEDFCCLGVLCELAVEDGVLPEPELKGSLYEYEDTVDGVARTGALPIKVQSWAEVPPGFEGLGYIKGVNAPLSSLNDTGSSFEDIANIIEENL